MKKQYPFHFLIIILFLSLLLISHAVLCQDLKPDKALDEKVGGGGTRMFPIPTAKYCMI